MSTSKRLGILGGAFDPPHRGHLTLAQCAIAQFALDELRVIPTGQAWHKSHALTAAPHRLAMTRLAFDALPRTVVDAREIMRPGPSYTVDTLSELHRERPDWALYLLIGADQARVFQTWHRWQDIARMATVVVAERPSAVDTATHVLPAAQRSQWHNAVSPDAQRLHMPSLNVSATQIRAHFAQAAQPVVDLSAWLPASVQHYIEQHSLYRTNR